jgi:hypothetical protein
VVALDAIMKATLIIRRRVVYEDGAIAAMVVRKVPEPVEPTTHGFKYSLAYVVGSRRVLSYDNERGKGDHRHSGGTEEPFEFKTIPDLLARFVAEIENMRGQS